VQRQQPRAGTAAAPRLDFQPSTNGEPCACLVFIHNNERNARLTAELMHRYVNIETPISPASGQTDAQLREESYASIAGVLRAVGLHCCGDDAEGRVRAGLRRGSLEEPAAR